MLLSTFVHYYNKETTKASKETPGIVIHVYPRIEEKYETSKQ